MFLVLVFLSVFFALCPALFFCPLPWSVLLFFFLVCVVCFPVFCLLSSACYAGCGRGLATVTVCCPVLTQPTLSAVPFLSTSSSCSLVPGLCPCWRFATSCFLFLLSACCAVWLCRGGVFLRGGYAVLAWSMSSLLLNASSPKGASAHVMHAVLLRLVCPLASCPVMVVVRMLACLCATRARSCLCCGCGGWARC